VRAALALVALGASAACTKHETRVLLDLDCGPLKARFEERAAKSFSNTTWDLLLLVERGGRFVEVDRADHRGGPEKYSRLLPAETGFRAFPFDEARPRDESYNRSSLWGVFAKPSAVSRPEYDALASCLAANAKAIDQALASRPGDGSLSAWPDRRPQISSIVRADYDPEYDLCGPKTVGARWTCGAGEGYIKTRVGTSGGGSFILCTAKPRKSDRLASLTVTYIPNGMVVGNDSTDQSAVFLTKPDTTSYEYQTLLAGKDAKAYYASCRDESGRSFFDTFKPLDEPAEATPSTVNLTP
jgi:hypothetical protein